MDRKSFLIIVIFLSVFLHIVRGTKGAKVPYGEKCHLPAKDRFVLAEHECDESKGLFCQQVIKDGYQYCGCGIDSLQNYDPLSGECRRMPYRRCEFINETLEPERFKELPSHLKCHRNAVCVQVDLTTDSGEEVKGICHCLEGFNVTWDYSQCVKVDQGDPTPPSINTSFWAFLILFVIIGLLLIAFILRFVVVRCRQYENYQKHVLEANL